MKPLAPWLVVTALSCGCGITIEYGKPDAPSRSSGTEETCYMRERIAVVEADSMVEWGTSQVKHRGRVDGFAFYRNGTRISPAQVLAELGDDELRTTYEARSRSLARARRGSAALTLVGIGIALGGAAVTTLAIGTQSEGLLITSGMITVGTGVALAISGQSRWRKWKGLHQAYEQIFVDGTLANRLDYALRRHDRGVAKRCEFDIISIPDP
jgi:hypothetical protein